MPVKASKITTIRDYISFILQKFTLDLRGFGTIGFQGNGKLI